MTTDSRQNGTTINIVSCEFICGYVGYATICPLLRAVYLKLVRLGSVLGLDLVSGWLVGWLVVMHTYLNESFRYRCTVPI